MIDPSVLRAMKEAGATAEVIVAAIEAEAVLDEQRAAAERARSAHAERQARYLSLIHI